MIARLRLDILEAMVAALFRASDVVTNEERLEKRGQARGLRIALDLAEAASARRRGGKRR